MDKLSQHYALLLGLNEDWLVANINLDLDAHRVEIHLEHNPDRPVSCPECNQHKPLKDHAPSRRWRHLDTMQFETILVARAPRTNCDKCGVLTAELPWAEPHGRFTLLFEAFAIRVLQVASSIDQGRKLLRLDWRAANTIMKSAVQRGLESRQLDELKHVGIDEKNFGKGHDYISVLTDIDGGRVLEVTQGRTEESADLLWKTVPEEVREEIEGVAVDMWTAFVNSTEKHVPEADIVHDRFHIAKHLGEAVDQVRRAEHKTLKQEGDERLTGSRYLWLTNEENLSEARAATFENLKAANLKTSRAWALREMFRAFYEQPTEAAGREFFKNWYAWASRCRLKPVIKVAKMIHRHFERIVTWFSHRISNATAEGFNSLIQSVKSSARGFRNFENYRVRILFKCGKLDLFPETSWKPEPLS